MDMSVQGAPGTGANDINRMSRLAKEAETLAGKASMRNESSKLLDVCRDFEALFIKQMLDVMRKTVKKESLTHGGFSEEIFEDMLYDEYSKKMARTANLGIAEMIYDQYSKYVDEK
jgi:flagellar protein FlgJ